MLHLPVKLTSSDLKVIPTATCNTVKVHKVALETYGPRFINLNITAKEPLSKPGLEKLKIRKKNRLI